MERHAADNKYLHREFHNIFNLGINYITENFGEEALVEYLTQFAHAFYQPLISEIREKGLVALEAYITDIYKEEEALGDIELAGNSTELLFTVKRCPAVRFMRSTGNRPAPLYALTSELVFKTIAKESGYTYRMLSYDEETGAAQHHFLKGAANI